ncbi:hypothetical protein E1A91_D05G423500v1 [Gossypium mustelinum]|uniref:non-specific serine/threonine protein kinase n=1 Tax=Gossypium mustelinum TaxID=34275 RepID=A0A5D2V799_GOSMU|nr:hypothetical protein E1A91_D05G423500v1 [Gossypium mustelinum]
MESWNSSTHYCQWNGVTCGRKHQRVTKLELQNLKLSGSLSPYIGNLSFLKELNLVGNNFYNQIPQEIGYLRRLETLELINNSISGEIPSNLSACSKLAIVDMRGNQLTGEIPASLGLLSNLKLLRFSNNSLRGSIPPSLGNLSSLQVFAFAMNGLTGIIPETLGQLTNLSLFTISSNAISGIVPLAMFNLSNIRVFDIGLNKIQCTLHSDLAINMPYVDFFSIGLNQISGQIPVSLSNCSNLNILQFNDNRLSGNVPPLEKLDKLYKLYMGTNHLGHGREGDLNFLCTLVNNTELGIVYISRNNFGGAFPECIGNFSRTLLHLRMEQNKIWGRIPDGIRNLINLEWLETSQNQLSGPIPFDIGRLQKLRIFLADGNFLFGTTPHCIGNLTMLTELALDVNNLHGNIPASLANCQNLVSLGLSYNNLSGSIPDEVLGISSLSITLDLSANYLTGDLPVAVEKLQNLGEFHVSKNRLSGSLPNSLGSCLRLEKLFLDGNLFEGPIPASLSSLRGLVELDVSDNNLSGEIPKFLTSMVPLKYLNLSFNTLEGVVPSEGVFKNASATFVEGNNKLCGKKDQQPTTIIAKNSLLRITYQRILMATDGFSTQNLVGSGSFGSVYKGTLEESGAVIAVKVLNLLNSGASRSFLAECEALKNIRHRNLVKLLTAVSGFDHQGNDFKALVYEFMANGSLEDWLHPFDDMNGSKAMRNLSFVQRINAAIDVAHALEYLHHGCEIPIIHCDIKPSNILLDEKMVGHISDFGLAKILSVNTINYSTNQSSSLGLRGTIGYTPPEYAMGSELSTKGDVYSYGILLLEMFTRKRPTDESFKENLSLRNFVKAALPGRVIEIIDPILLQERAKQGTVTNITFNKINLGNDIHLQCLNSIFELGIICSADSPSERIDMIDVVSKLCSIRCKLLTQRYMMLNPQITGDELRVMESWNSPIHFCQWHGVTCGRKHQRVTKLELQYLKLSGSLSPYIGNLSFLKELNLVGNNFYNQIPQEIGYLRRLETLELINNSISGEIPSNLSACSKLAIVDMRGNQLTGEIPASLGLLSNLKLLKLSNNSLRGSIPPSLGNLSSLQVFAFAMNGLTGIIPEALGQLTNLSLFTISSNAVSGLNQISGQIPVSLFNCSNLNILQFNDNRLRRIPDGIRNLINLEWLATSKNQLLGPIPFDIGRLQKLRIFLADGNFLFGTIPHCIGNLTMLTELTLDFNNLHGNIPSSLANCQNLVSLGLSYNNLSGSIPNEVLGISSLSITLDLSANYLTGDLPVAVEKLQNLGEFHVSKNRLSGSLPNSLGSCLRLEKLFLVGNVFEGPIPASLSSLRGLVELDVSDNNLSGEIPKFLASMVSLKYLNLSFNTLEGVVPSEGVFKNASATFVEGNNKLCGVIPALHLPRCNLKTSSNTSFRIIIEIVVILGVPFIFVFLLFLWLKKKKDQQPTTICAQNSLLRITYQRILMATDGFSTQNLVGSGSFGSVYKGTLEESGAVIAVKVLNLLNSGASRSFLAECEALKNIRHRNLVKLLTAISGVDHQGNDFKALVYEFMANGSLEDWLHPFDDVNGSQAMRNLSFVQRINAAIDVAHALEYLHHGCEIPIIHCDLKPSNILLDEKMVGHISDFGLAKILSVNTINYSTNQSSSLGLRGTIGYTPPETFLCIFRDWMLEAFFIFFKSFPLQLILIIICDELVVEYAMGSELSTKGDVYSYGILLLEMFTRKRPTDESFKENLSLRNFVKAALHGRVIEIIDPILLQERAKQGTVTNITFNKINLGNDIHLQCLNSIFELGIICSADSPSERIGMIDVVSKLCSIRCKLLTQRYMMLNPQVYNNVLLC